MQMAEQFDISTLAWVKGEIDETLKQARIALESYVEDSEQGELLQNCIDYIHQVYGTLQVVELTGAALFAEELENFASALLRGETSEKQLSYELLMRGILQLPDYLESLLDGQSDNPILLIPLLNEMRQLRAEQPLDSMAFFHPDLGISPPHTNKGKKPSASSQEAAQKLHRFYLSSLAKLIKGKEIESSLHVIANLIERLATTADGDNWRRILWIASAYIEALQDDSIALDRDSKPLLGKLEQQIKSVAAHGEAGESDAATNTLLEKMLYQIAVSDAKGKQAGTLRLAFGLDRYLPGGQSGLNADLKKTVSADIMDELSRIKDAFDIFVRSERSSTAGLEPMVQSLTSMADTLGLLQEESLRQILQEQNAIIDQLLSGKVEATDDVLMGIAGAILSVESALGDWGSSAPVVLADARDEQVGNDDSTPQAEAEHQRVTRQVMREAKEDLIRVREAISSYLSKPEDRGLLEPLPSLLHMIIGSLTLLSYRRVAQVLTSCRGFIEQELINGHELPEAYKLDALADAVMSVEYYLEAFIHSRVHPGSVLDVAEQSVATLGYPIGLLSEPVDSDSVEAMPDVDGIEVVEDRVDETDFEISDTEQTADLIESYIPDESVDQDDTLLGDELSLEFLDSLQMGTTTDDEFEPDSASFIDTGMDGELADGTALKVESELEAENAGLAEAADENIAATPVPQAAPVARPIEVDDEIIEIFIEEAEEELANIRQLLPQWAANPSDGETLKNLRRSFHTLKGSGRLVGALELGEFAWAFENMLNRLLDGNLQTNATIFDMLDQAVDTLPSLIEAFRDSTVVESDAEMLREMAAEIAQPGGVKLPPVSATTSQIETLPEPIEGEDSGESAEEEEGVAEQGITDDDAEIPELDSILLEIYSKETESHLRELDDFIARYLSGGSHKVTEPLIRALHTLKGSSRMAGVMPVADVCEILEKYTKTLQATHESMGADGIEALSSCRNYILAMLPYLADRGIAKPDASNALNLAAEIFDKVQHLEDIANAQPEAGLASKDERELNEIDVAPAIPDSEVVAEDSSLLFEIIGDEFEAIPDDISLLDTDDYAAEIVTDDVSIDLPPATQQEEDYDDELLEIFLEEGAEILDASEETLQAWVDNPADRSLVEALQRQLHTLKGGARMAGIRKIGDLSHSLETAIDMVIDGLLQHSPEMTDLLQLSHDRLVTMLEQVRQHKELTSGDDLILRINALSNGPQDTDTAATVADESFSSPVDDALAVFAEDELHLHQQRHVEQSEDELLVAPPVSSAEQTEWRSILPAIDEVAFHLSNWLRDTDDRELFDAINAAAKSLQGQCAEQQQPESMAIAHSVVQLLAAIGDGHVPVSSKANDLVFVAMDRMRQINGELERGEQASHGQFVISDIEDLISLAHNEEQGGAAAVDGGDFTTRSESDVEVAAEEHDAAPAPQETVDDAEGNKRHAPRIQHEVVRVRADLLDDLVNYAGEVSIYRSRVEQQIGTFRSNILEMDQTITRLRDQVRQFEIENEAQIESRREEAQKSGYEDFDPLEFDRFTHMQQLSRSMMESLSDLYSIENMLSGLTRETETLLLQQSRVNTDLQESLVHTRMVPLVENAPRLRRVVRQTAAELGKRTSLSFDGVEVELDRNVVERLMAPLEHMLRNSIAHGIESRNNRIKAGKPEEGNILIALSREGSEIVVRVSDDGSGINFDAVRKKAIERGLMKADARLSDKDVARFILQSGFSTAESLSQISGRGVGMDVVGSEIKQLGGVLDIESAPGKGTTFTIRLPLTLTVSRALLVQVVDDTYAIPLMGIRSIDRISGTELENLLSIEEPAFTWLGDSYPLMHLTAVLGMGQGVIHSESGKQALLLAGSGEQRIALVVDNLLGSREVVVKSLGPLLSNINDLAGATILADGSVAPIIDMPSLIRRGLANKDLLAQMEQTTFVPEEREPVIMVVDDSITVRKVTERLLSRHNMKCVTAKDGVDALATLEEIIPDVMLLDIEMPRMDGFELATHMRNSEKFKTVPIIMITSRTGDKHRQRAMEIGVNMYMGKPYTEVDLLENIQKLMGR